MNTFLSLFRRSFVSLLVLGYCLALSPLVAGQEKQEDVQPDKWAGSMAKFAAQDEASPPKPGGIVFVGSSSIVKWDLKEWFPDLPVVNRGFGGSTIADSVRHFNTLIPPHKPSIIVFYAGDNDIAQKKSPEQVSEDFAKFAALVKKSAPQAQCVYIPIKPSGSRWNLIDVQKQANQLIRDQIEKDTQWTYLPIEPLMLNGEGVPDDGLFLKDRLHMNNLGYEKWVTMLRPLLDKMMKEKE